MEKLTLKPAFREILHKGAEPDVFFDVLTFSGTTTQEKNLGSIAVLSYLRQKDDDLSYLVSLISSLAKREFYSPQSIAEQEPKAAFERTLKKLNEILVDYFENKDFTLNLGLAVISGDNLYISRLGRFKVALARNSEYIDILNNVHLFSKEDGDEHQFANIISGKLKPNDKIFAYFPLRTVSAREKMLNPLFVSQVQGDFCDKVDGIAKNAPNFACCGVHVALQQVKEIPVELKVDYGEKVKPELEEETAPVIAETAEKKETGVVKEDDELMPIAPGFITPPTAKPKSAKSPAPSMTASNVIRAEMSVAKRDSFFNRVGAGILSIVAGRKKNLGMIGQRRSSGYKWVIGAILLLAVAAGGWWFLGPKADSGSSVLVEQASQSLMLAKSRLGQNDAKEARTILRNALAMIGAVSGDKLDPIKAELFNTLDIIDQVSNNSAERVTGTENDIGLSSVAVFKESVYVVGKENTLYLTTPDGFAELGRFSFSPKILSANADFVSAFDGVNNVSSYDIAHETFADYALKEAVSSQDAKFYQNNLYTVNGTDILKYADAVTGGTKGAVWGSVETDSEVMSIAIDGDILVLDKDGKITRLFKGKKEAEFNLSILPSAGSKIFADPDSSFLYIADFQNSRVYVFDKTSGSLKTSYKLDGVGQVKDVCVSADGTVWIVSEKAVFQIKP